MAVTTSVVARWVNGPYDEAIIDLTPDSSYAASGGEALTAHQLGFRRVDHVTSDLSAGGYMARYDRSTDKLTVFVGDNNNTSDGPLIEAASTTDLDAETFRVRITGQAL